MAGGWPEDRVVGLLLVYGDTHIHTHTDRDGLKTEGGGLKLREEDADRKGWRNTEKETTYSVT